MSLRMQAQINALQTKVEGLENRLLRLETSKKNKVGRPPKNNLNKNIDVSWDEENKLNA